MVCDLLIVGGGVNGAAIARDAAGRGLSVRLIEQNDLASATSSASTKLIHGGLRYLELYEFRLVREALAERETMLRAAPHIIWPLEFVLPHEKGLRPAWMIRVGLFLYDHLAKRERLPGSRMVSLRDTAHGAPLRADFSTGFTYADCWVDDARLVVLNALDARERGARVEVGARLDAARREGKSWRATVTHDDGRVEEIETRALVNAAGPWVARLLESALHVHAHKHLRLVKGSHIVTRKLYYGPHAYILQNADRRVIFAIPYERDFTLIGTTDVAYDGAPGPVAITDAETDYLLAAVNRSWRKPVTRDDVVWSYAGLRPLFDDGALQASVVTRDYAFDLDAPPGEAPSLSVFGGKITTARRLAEHALEALAPVFPGLPGPWTHDVVLPGGDLGAEGFDAFLARLTRNKPFLPPEAARRLARAYGTRVHAILGAATQMSDLGADFGGGFTEAEARYLIAQEWARTADDVLWRRSKLGLHLTPDQQERVRAFMA